jgi:hypothetical protein
MSFPATLDAMETAGYKRSNFSRCSGCMAAIEWWITPNKARIPMNPMPDLDSPAISHYATCPKAKQFRKEPARCTSQTSTLQDSQPSLFLVSSSPESDSSTAAPSAPPPVVKPKKKNEN